MAAISIKRNHTFSMDEIKNKIDSMSENVLKKYGINSVWEGDILKVKGKGVKGDIKITNSDLDIQLKLDFMLRPFKNKIEESIARKIDEQLA